jgi:hypothetical protein
LIRSFCQRGSDGFIDDFRKLSVERWINDTLNGRVGVGVCVGAAPSALDRA